MPGSFFLKAGFASKALDVAALTNCISQRNRDGLAYMQPHATCWQYYDHRETWSSCVLPRAVYFALR